MTPIWIRAAVVVSVGLAVASCSTAPTSGAALPSATAGSVRVLVFSRTMAYRHPSIPAGQRLFASLPGYLVDLTEDAGSFTADNLRRYAAVVFLSTTGDVLNEQQQVAFEAYIRGGGGFLGIHAAADTEYGWPFYGPLVGAWFANHPPAQPATVRVVDPTHPATAGLPLQWRTTDEWYNFRTDPTGAVTVLLTVDESTYAGGTMGPGHPIAWCHEYQGGRSFYLGLGHPDAAYADPSFRLLVAFGLRYAAGRTTADRVACDTPRASRD